MKENCQNSKTRDDIDMKLEPVTKIENGNKTTSKNLVMTSFWYIMTSLLCFLIYGQFGSIRKLHSRRIVCKTHISIESNFLFYKNWKQKSYKNFNTVLTILFWVKVLFWQKFCSFSKKKKKKNAGISKIKRALELNGVIYETTYVCTYQIWSFYQNSNKY